MQEIVEDRFGLVASSKKTGEPFTDAGGNRVYYVPVGSRLVGRMKDKNGNLIVVDGNSEPVIGADGYFMIYGYNPQKGGVDAISLAPAPAPDSDDDGPNWWAFASILGGAMSPGLILAPAGVSQFMSASGDLWYPDNPARSKRVTELHADISATYGELMVQDKQITEAFKQLGKRLEDLYVELKINPLNPGRESVESGAIDYNASAWGLAAMLGPTAASLAAAVSLSLCANATLSGAAGPAAPLVLVGGLIGIGILSGEERRAALRSKLNQLCVVRLRLHVSKLINTRLLERVNGEFFSDLTMDSDKMNYTEEQRVFLMNLKIQERLADIPLAPESGFADPKMISVLESDADYDLRAKDYDRASWTQEDLNEDETKTRVATEMAVSPTQDQFCSDFAWVSYLGVDAVAVLPNGKMYATRGPLYFRYSDPKNTLVADDGYPTKIAGQWGALPQEFDAGFDKMRVVDGKTYISKGNMRAIYSDESAIHVDSIETLPGALTYRQAGLLGHA